jgi:hypothetical protein
MFLFIPLVNRELDNHWYGHDCLVAICKAKDECCVKSNCRELVNRGLTVLNERRGACNLK